MDDTELVTLLTPINKSTINIITINGIIHAATTPVKIPINACFIRRLKLNISPGARSTEVTTFSIVFSALLPCVTTGCFFLLYSCFFFLFSAFLCTVRRSEAYCFFLCCVFASFLFA